MTHIAIDGPGGAGKSSVAKLIAEKLKFIYVDTGALYRAVGYYMVTNGIRPRDAESVVAALPNVKISLKFTDRQELYLCGEDVGDKIRTPEISMAASDVSAIPEVRAFLLETQRSIARTNSVIMDGRDIGTVILPNADLKIFLFASPEARAKRRYAELTAKGQDVTFESVLTEMNERDTNDSTRAAAPCIPAEDAILLDNSNLDLQGTADAIIALLEKKKQLNKEIKVYNRLRAVLAAPLRFLFGVRAIGTENIPAHGGVLICSNHLGMRDPVLIAAAYPRQVRFIAKKELFSVPIVRSLISAFGAIRLDRSGTDVGALKKAEEMIRMRQTVSIFPQGHRSPTLPIEETTFKHGAGFIASHTDCTVLPVYIQTKGQKYALFRRIRIHFGKPIAVKQIECEDSSKKYEAITEKIREEIIALEKSANEA
jgi:cytidylate kinase